MKIFILIFLQKKISVLCQSDFLSKVMYTYIPIIMKIDFHMNSLKLTISLLILKIVLFANKMGKIIVIQL